MEYSTYCSSTYNTHSLQRGQTLVLWFGKNSFYLEVFFLFGQYITLGEMQGLETNLHAHPALPLNQLWALGATICVHRIVVRIKSGGIYRTTNMVPNTLLQFWRNRSSCDQPYTHIVNKTCELGERPRKLASGITCISDRMGAWRHPSCPAFTLEGPVRWGMGLSVAAMCSARILHCTRPL